METLKDIREELKNMLNEHSIDINIEYLSLEDCKIINLMFCGLPIAGKEVTANAIKMYMNISTDDKKLKN